MFAQMRYVPLHLHIRVSFRLVQRILQSLEADVTPRKRVNGREALRISKQTDILDHMHSLPEPAQSEAQAKIRAIESAAMTSQEPQPGLVELMEYLETRGVRKGICTRNFDGPVMHLLNKFLPGRNFDPIITRDFRPPKPDPAGILRIAKAWALEDRGESIIMVFKGPSRMSRTFSSLTGSCLLLGW